MKVRDAKHEGVALNIGELIRELHDAGVIQINGSGKNELNDWLDRRGVDPETPVPVWNPDAQAWEV